MIQGDMLWITNMTVTNISISLHGENQVEHLTNTLKKNNTEQQRKTTLNIKIKLTWLNQSNI